MITDVLRDSTVRVREVVREAITRYFGAESGWRDLKVLADGWGV